MRSWCCRRLPRPWRQGFHLLLVTVALPGSTSGAGATDGVQPDSRISRRAATPNAAPGPALAKFHARLAQLEAGEIRQVVVLQIGDSHTASDHLSGHLRSLLQKRFGNAGRGLLPPGAPHDYYRPYQIAVAQTGKWRVLTSNKIAPDPVPFGLSGTVARGHEPTDIIAIDDRSGTPLSSLEVGYLRRPDGGSFQVWVDGQPLAASTTSDGNGQRIVATYEISGPGQRIEVRPSGNGPVDLTDLRLIGKERGIQLANIGFPGAQVGIMARWHADAVSRQLTEIDPALIIMAFGTNEGFASLERIAGTYARTLDKAIALLAAAAPHASIAVVGPPDANRYPRFCLPPAMQAPAPEPAPAPADRAPIVSAEPAEKPAVAAPGQTVTAAEPAVGRVSDTGSAGPAPPPLPRTAAKGRRALVPPEPPPHAICEPLSAEEREGYDKRLSAHDRRLCRWHTPAAIPLVRNLQRAAAATHGALFWDWSELFEGECGADRWFRRGLAHKDRVHFKQQGYALAAQRLYAALLAGYLQAAAGIRTRE